MVNARFSVLVWAIYELVIGVSLVLIPTQIMQVFGIDEPQEVWIKVVGLFVVLIGVYYLGAVFNNSTWTYRYTVFGRLIAVVGLIYLAILDGPWQLILFAVLDALGALWTFSALRPKPVVYPTGASAE
jgi:hypothetical protein